MVKEFEVHQKLQKIEKLYYGAKTTGERVSAKKAKVRILNKIKSEDKATIYKFKLDNELNVDLLLNVMYKYEIDEFKKSKKQPTTVIAKVSAKFVDRVLWPEYLSTPKKMII
ncbi:MAG: hypothetical protein OCD02_00695 [Spirochaetaceae bacterium]